MKKIILIIALLFSTFGFSQEPKDDIYHYAGSAGLTALTYSIPRNNLKLPILVSTIISFGLNEVVAQLVEHSQSNHYSKKDLRINRYGTLTGVLTFEFFNQKNKADDLENKLIEVNKELSNLKQSKKQRKLISLELKNKL